MYTEIKILNLLLTRRRYLAPQIFKEKDAQFLESFRPGNMSLFCTSLLCTPVLISFALLNSELKIARPHAAAV